MRKSAVFLALFLIITSVALAQENMGARPIAMGGAFTGLADDVNAIFLNPAGIGYIRGEMASVSTKISEGKEYTLIGGVERTAIGSFGIGYIGASKPLESADDGVVYVDDGNKPVKELNQTLVLSYARELNDFMVVPRFMGRLSLGTNLKLSSMRVANAKGLSEPTGSAVNADVAAVFRPNDDLSWGFNLKNCFDRADAEDGSEDQSGMVAAFGVSGNVFDKTLTWSVEDRCMGVEWKPMGQGLALRMGKDGDYNTAGFGISISGFGIDYAYLEKEEKVHYVAVSIAIEREQKEADMRQAGLSLQ